jgi:hypothetical protein
MSVEDCYRVGLSAVSGGRTHDPRRSTALRSSILSSTTDTLIKATVVVDSHISITTTKIHKSFTTHFYYKIEGMRAEKT